ncbi:MAG: HEAT repeat domain-containing protein, partial [Pyrinomonadaceae bacterium]
MQTIHQPNSNSCGALVCLRRTFLVVAATVLCVAQSAAQAKTSVSMAVLTRIVRAEDERRWEEADLGALLNNGDARVRERAALATGRIGDPRAVGPLAFLIEKDPDEDVRRMAAFALGEIEAPEAARALLAALARKEGDAGAPSPR